MSASNTPKGSLPSQRGYPPEIRERAVRMVRQALKESDRSHGVVTRVAGQLGLGSETLRKWVKQAQIDEGERPGETSEEHRRIVELERENRELRRANEILKVAAAFLARELDPRLPA
jgi:transposase